MTSMVIIGTAVKIASACGIGIGASTLFTMFHKYEFKMKNKKGDKNGLSANQSLRERAKDIS
jgi:galactitol-specific phosphotransferase system IIB component